MYVHVRVMANAKREEFIVKKNDSFVVRVKERAEQNMANTRVRELVALHFSVPVAAVRIVNGHHEPSKLLSVAGIDLAV